MRTFGVIMSIFSMSLVISLVFAISANAAPAVVIDEVNMTYDIETPAYNDTVIITAPVVAADADIVKVELIWMLCIEDQCFLPTTVEMTDDGAGNYKQTIGPFDERDGNGNLYKDIGFTVKVTYTATGGGDELTTESETVEIFFDQTSATPVDNDTDTDTDDDDDDDKKTPFGMEIVILGILVAIGVIMFKKERK